MNQKKEKETKTKENGRKEENFGERKRKNR